MVSFSVTLPGLFWWELVEIKQDGKFNNLLFTSLNSLSPGESIPKCCVNLVPSYPLSDKRGQGRRLWSFCFKKVVILYQGGCPGFREGDPLCSRKGKHGIMVRNMGSDSGRPGLKPDLKTY